MTQQEFVERYEYNTSEDRIGGGAFGTVFRAYDRVLDRYVAIKMAQVKYIEDKEFSLISEVAATIELPDHKNIANYETVHQMQTPLGLVDFAIMQYYEVGNLKQLLKQKELSQRHKVTLATGLLSGIAYLHDNKVLHRDLKPSNILISKYKEDFTAKIADFGLSKFVDSEEHSSISNSFGGGTLGYSSPEQLIGNKLKYNTDLWSIGVIIYEVFTGERPFSPNDSEGSPETKRRKTYQNIVNAPVPDKVNTIMSPFGEIVKQCLVKNPSDRVSSAHDLLNQVQEAQTITDETTIIVPASILNPISTVVHQEDTLITKSQSALIYEQQQQKIAKQEAEAKAKAEQEAKLKAEAEAKAKEEVRQKAEIEAKAKAEKEARQKAEQEARRKAETEAKRKAEDEARQKAEAKAKQEAKLKAEAEAKAQQEAKRKAKKEAKRLKDEERKLEAKLNKEHERKLKQEQKRIAKEKADALKLEKRKAKEEAKRQRLVEAKKTVSESQEKEYAWKRYLLLLLFLPFGVGIMYLNNTFKRDTAAQITSIIEDDSGATISPIKTLTIEDVNLADYTQLKELLVTHSDSPLIEQINQRLLSLETTIRQEEYTRLLKKPTVSELERFILTYEGTPEADDAKNIIEGLISNQRFENESDAFNQARESLSISMLEKFISEFPTSENKEEALLLIEELKEKQSWESAQAQNTIQGYTDYINDHSTGQHTQKAISALNKLQQERDWALIIKNPTRENIQEFLSKYPSSPYQSLANDKLELIEESEWLAVKKINTIDALIKFNSKYPDSKFNTEVKMMLNDLYEKRDWQNVDKNSRTDIEKFIELYPLSDKIEKAKSLLIEIEESEWLAASRINSEESYGKYIENYPDGKFLNEAQKAILNLRANKETNNNENLSTIKNSINSTLLLPNNSLEDTESAVNQILDKINFIDSKRIVYFMKSEKGDVINIYKPIKQYLTEGILLKSITIDTIEKSQDGKMSIIFIDKLIARE